MDLKKNHNEGLSPQVLDLPFSLKFTLPFSSCFLLESLKCLFYRDKLVGCSATSGPTVHCCTAVMHLALGLLEAVGKLALIIININIFSFYALFLIRFLPGFPSFFRYVSFLSSHSCTSESWPYLPLPVLGIFSFFQHCFSAQNTADWEQRWF